MIQFTNPYSQYVFTRTLEYMRRVEPRPPKHGLAPITFEAIADNAMSNPEVMYTVSILGRDVDNDVKDVHVGREFYFKMEPITPEINEVTHIVEFKPRSNPICGVWHNHGSSENPAWGSHT